MRQNCFSILLPINRSHKVDVRLFRLYHCDIKLDNIFLYGDDSDGKLELKIGDFGLYVSEQSNLTAQGISGFASDYLCLFSKIYFQSSGFLCNRKDLCFV